MRQVSNIATNWLCQIHLKISVNTVYHKEENRLKLRAIVSRILFRRRHDLPLSGKLVESSVFKNLLYSPVDT